MMIDPNAPLQQLLSVSHNAALAGMSEAELIELAVHLRERHTGQLKEEARERDRIKRMEAKARKAAKPG